MIRLTRAFAAAACWGVLAGGAPVAGAQAAGDLVGIVRDATGAVVPGVTVTVTGESLPASVVVETDQQGRFALTLPPGLYDLRADAAGFASWGKEVELKASGATLDIPLRVELRDGVTVTATRTGTADIQTTGVSITALDASALEAGAVERVEHLAGLVPTLSFSHTPGGPVARFMMFSKRVHLVLDIREESFVSPGIVDVSNAPATSKGIEVEGAVSPGQGFQFLGMMAWLDAAYGRYIPVERSPITMAVTKEVDATGNRLRDAPRWSGSGAAIDEFQPAGSGTVSLRGDLLRQSRVFFLPSNEAVQSQSAYALMHACATFVPRHRRWEASVYVRNLGHQEYVTATWAASGGAAISGRPGEPRHWGTQLTIRR